LAIRALLGVIGFYLSNRVTHRKIYWIPNSSWFIKQLKRLCTVGVSVLTKLKI